MPNPFELVLNLTKEAANIAANAIKTGQPFVDENTMKQRRSICTDCEFFLKEELRCGICGCYLQFKTKFAASKCPKDKW